MGAVQIGQRTPATQCRYFAVVLGYVDKRIIELTCLLQRLSAKVLGLVGSIQQRLYANCRDGSQLLTVGHR